MEGDLYTAAHKRATQKQIDALQAELTRGPEHPMERLFAQVLPRHQGKVSQERRQKDEPLEKEKEEKPTKMELTPEELHLQKPPTVKRPEPVHSPVLSMGGGFKTRVSVPQATNEEKRDSSLYEKARDRIAKSREHVSAARSVVIRSRRRDERE